ncbi:MAG: amidohydrolase family protein [Bacillota bacterium]|nr:amidohydrolase family protein [Bacillota bacterium]
MKKSFVIKGDICYCQSLENLLTIKDGFLVCQDGISQGAFANLPDQYSDFELLDFSNMLIIPGLVDLHLHGPQNHYKGLGMDLELLDWLNTYTFPEEAKFKDLDFAMDKYRLFVEEIKRSPSTRLSIFASLHLPATILLMDLMEESGLISYVGRVNMDRNGGADLEEDSAEDSVNTTLAWLEAVKAKGYERTFPIITPRFIPSCSDQLMDSLSKIRSSYKLPVQSHLSENQGEILWVQDLCPGSKSYADAYDQFKMLGFQGLKTIMAHCVWTSPEEEELLKDKDVFVAHCPDSNTNLSSGIAPIRRFLDNGLKLGLGTDVGAGSSLSIFKAMVDAIQVSKMYWRLVDQNAKALSAKEAFYLGTLGGGEFFGKLGSFAEGYEFDCLVVDDSRFSPWSEWNIEERLERVIYLAQDSDLVSKFVRGRKIF